MSQKSVTKVSHKSQSFSSFFSSSSSPGRGPSLVLEKHAREANNRAVDFEIRTMAIMCKAYFLVS